MLIYLPVYSPELNPIERLWLNLRQQLDVFDASVRTSLEVLRERVAGQLRSYSEAQLARLTGYLYLVEAANALINKRTPYTPQIAANYLKALFST